MYRKFRDYLDKDFRFLPSNEQVRDFKEELLGTLMDKDNELLESGITDENERFRLCLEAIEGYKDTLNELKGNPKVVAAVKKGALGSMVWSSYMFIIVGAFLAVSFIFDDVWSKSWLIIAGGVLLWTIAKFILTAAKNISSKKFTVARAALVPAVSLVAVAVYLTISVLFDLWHPMWLVFVALPAVISAMDFLLALGTGEKNKTKLVLRLSVFIMSAAVVVYLTISILGVTPWHPYWLIIFGAAAVNALLLTIFFYNKRK